MAFRMLDEKFLEQDFVAYSLMANKLDFRKVPFSKIKIILYKKSDELQIQFKISGRDLEFKTATILKSASKNILRTPKNVFQQTLNILPQVTIPNDKKKDIKDLLIFLPTIDQIYFKNLLNI